MKRRNMMAGVFCLAVAAFLTACAGEEETGVTTQKVTVQTTVTTSVTETSATETSGESTATTSFVSKTTWSETEGKSTTTASPTSKKTCNDNLLLKRKVFSSAEEYARYMEKANEATLRVDFTGKGPIGPEYFSERNFEIVLKERKYPMPIIPKGYALKNIEMNTSVPMTATLEKDGQSYTVTCLMYRDEKPFPDSGEEEAFLRADGAKVMVRIDEIGFGGTYRWKEDGYIRYVRFSETNRSGAAEIAKEFATEIVPIV